ncbi:SDR family oxidoreductase [Kribbella kalugense]|uniref:SDR family oxidoreductase n=1 Tax=Kribbella kalugense TaxID=2512221 RepID=UPI00192E26A2|nr:NAD(P)H-binding protein [Kribbella kalugense]
MPDTADPTGSRHRPSILVTGATGNVGREVVNRLVERDARVRCLVRNRPEPRSDVDWVVGDLTDPTDVREAMVGVDTVFLIWPLLDSGPACEVVTELAATTPRVVYLSSTAIDDSASRQSDSIVQVHAEMERLLHHAGLSTIVLRSDTLASNARGWVAQLSMGDEVSGPDVARTPVVDERDVADAAVAALLTPNDELDQGLYLLTGPEALTRADQVAQLGAALHRPLRFRPLPADLARSRMLADGRPEPLVEALVSASVHDRRATASLITSSASPADQPAPSPSGPPTMRSSSTDEDCGIPPHAATNLLDDLHGVSTN